VERLTTELHDRADIGDRIARLAHAQDEKDWDAVRAAYREDAVYMHPGGRLEGADAILDRTKRALQSLDASQHLIGSVTVEVDGDMASSLAYFQAQHVRTDTPGGELYTIGGSYSDEWVRTAEGWRIATRTQTYHWRSGNRAVVAP
jgi:ketosteroid isomerase-like protein